MKPVLFIEGFAVPVSGGAVAPDGTVHVASVCPGVQEGAEEAVNVSLPVLPVSTDVLIKRFPVVLG